MALPGDRRRARDRVGDRTEVHRGFTRFWPVVLVLTGASLSFIFLATAMKTIPVGTAYAIWTGIGAAGTAIVAILLFGEAASPARLVSMGLIVAGIVSLNLTS